MKRKVYFERLIVSDEGIFSNSRLLSSVVYILEFSSVVVNIVQLKFVVFSIHVYWHLVFPVNWLINLSVNSSLRMLSYRMVPFCIVSYQGSFR